MIIDRLGDGLRFAKAESSGWLRSETGQVVKRIKVCKVQNRRARGGMIWVDSVRLAASGLVDLLVRKWLRRPMLRNQSFDIGGGGGP